MIACLGAWVSHERKFYSIHKTFRFSFFLFFLILAQGYIC